MPKLILCDRATCSYNQAINYNDLSHYWFSVTSSLFMRTVIATSLNQSLLMRVNYISFTHNHCTAIAVTKHVMIADNHDYVTWVSLRVGPQAAWVTDHLSMIICNNNNNSVTV